MEADTLRDTLGTVHPLATGKVLPKLDKYAKTYIGRSPFLCIATADADGNADCSPRGDPPGFVIIVEDNKLIIPDRPGNNRADTMLNIIANPKVGILFLIPGIDDTVRVNGRARIIDTPAELAVAAVKGKVPKLGIRIAIDEVVFHCAAAFRRSKLWDPAAHEARSFLPGLAKIVLDQARQCEVDDAEAEQVEAAIQEDYRTKLY
ncbi:pyridoxamine 5'-phosphate oxidase family protein [soil metagenome]